MRVVGLTLLLISASVSADDEPPARRISVGLEVFEYFPWISLEPLSQPREFGPPAQHTGITEIDLLVPIRVQPWLRVVPLVGFTVLSFGFNESFVTGQPDLAAIDQNAVVAGVGAQAFYRYRGWEGHADVQVHVPFAFGTNATFFRNTEPYDGQLHGGEIVTLTTGVARRLGPASIFFDLGYVHSIVSVRATGVGLAASFGGLLVAGGVSLW